MRRSPLHKKGIFTLSLIVLTESIAFSDAVHFWSTYQSWSSRYGNGREDFHQEEGFFSNSKTHTQPHSSSSSIHRSQSNFAKRNSDSIVQECSADKTCTTTTATTTTNPIENVLHPRKLSRVASGTRTCSTTMYECCKNNTPQCFGLDVRGGHGSHPDPIATASAADTVLTAAAAAGLPTPYNLPLNMWKVIFQIFLTALNVACWLIPLKADKITENKLAMGLANAFSGGVFLSLAFGHLIPECVHGFEGMNESLPYMIVLGGYLLIFFVEKVAFDAHGLMHDVGDDGHDHAHSSPKKQVKTLEGEDSSASGAGTGRSAVILLGALAVHSILEMTALGLARSFGDSALLSLSIALHQPAESIALLVAFLKSGMPKDEIFKFLSVFSLMGPIGVAIGMAVSEFAAPIFDSIMLATVAGTFVYVGATEVIPEEWEEQEHKWKKFFALMGGIVSIYGITQYTITLEGHAH